MYWLWSTKMSINVGPQASDFLVRDCLMMLMMSSTNGGFERRKVRLVLVDEFLSSLSITQIRNDPSKWSQDHYYLSTTLLLIQASWREGDRGGGGRCARDGTAGDPRPLLRVRQPHQGNVGLHPEGRRGGDGGLQHSAESTAHHSGGNRVLNRPFWTILFKCTLCFTLIE